MVRCVALILTLGFLAAATDAAQSIDARSLSRWAPQPGWTPTRLTRDFAAAVDGDWLVFSVRGAGKAMTWTLQPQPAELLGEPQYLLVRYRVEGVKPVGEMFVSAQYNASPWQHLLSSSKLLPDGKEHCLAVDTLSYRWPTPMDRLLVRLGPVADHEARLWIKMELSDVLPDGVEPVRMRWPAEQRVRLEIEKFKWKPSPEWTPNAPSEHTLESTSAGVGFRIQGARCSMRWSSRTAEPIDFTKTPYVTVRYRARGEFFSHGYVFYLGTTGTSPKTRSVYAMAPGDVNADGRWHVHSGKIDSKQPASGSIAVGIDALGPRTEIEIDYVEFSSQPPRVPLGEAIEFTTRDAAWPVGREGLTTLDLPADGKPNRQMLERMGIGSWFDHRDIAVDGIPFRVPAAAEQMPCTGTVDENQISVPLPPDVHEVFLLLAACFPREEKFGSSWERNAPLRVLDEPERMTTGLRYDDGTVDELLPVDVARQAYGVGHDFGVYSVQPTPGKRAVTVLVNDRMRNAAFGLAGVTVLRGQPRVTPPELPHVWYTTAPKSPISGTQVRLATQGGIAWEEIAAKGAAAVRVSAAGLPVFRLKLDKREIASTDFRLLSRQGGVWIGEYQQDGVKLTARVELTSLGAEGERMSLDLTNRSGEPVTGTLLFPTAEKLVLGAPADTWCFDARRGGVITNQPCQMRDEIGEGHALQVDGLFNPRLGGGISFQPRDREGVFRWYCMSKDTSGVSYALEYLPETVAPGKSWKSVAVVVTAVAGDWRDQLAAYRRWVDTWYRPLAPRKDWFRRVRSFCSYAPVWPESRPVDERLDFLALAERRDRSALGATDYVHLFGWAITKPYGHWGAYDHFEGVGGAERLAAAVQRCRKADKPVGLYLDGYLVSTQSDKPNKQQVEAWGVRQANGKLLYHDSYDAHSMCPYVPEWRKHLTDAYRRVADQIRPSGMYVDEFGKCMTSRICSSRAHGHPAPMGMCRGEWLLSEEIRRAVPPGIATYCEYVPADVACQYLDGAYGHVSLYNHRDGLGTLAPHFVNLHRFALPDFKTFELIYYVPLCNGNWFLLKYPFFNGDGYYLTNSEMSGDDQHAHAFLANVFRVQQAYADAFASTDVEPLVSTLQPGVYANRFATPAITVWTLYNANYRTARGPLLSLPHRAGATYFDAWNRCPVETREKAGQTVVEIAIGPRAVGCVVQETPKR